MKYIQPMTCNEFARHILTLNTGESVSFACKSYIDWKNATLTFDNVEWWYFAKVMEEKECDSKFIFMDFFGGGSPFAFPTNYYYDDNYVVEYVKKYLMEYCEGINNMNDYVFVEMEEE